MKKLILKSKCNGIKHIVTIIETSSIEFRYCYCLKTISKTFKDKILISKGIFNEFFETYEEMHKHYELIKKVNSSISSFTKIIESDEK